MNERINGVLGQDSTLECYTRLGTIQANEINFGMNHASVQDQSLDLLTCSLA